VAPAAEAILTTLVSAKGQQALVVPYQAALETLHGLLAVEALAEARAAFRGLTL
jgi:hypothetical protein